MSYISSGKNETVCPRIIGLSSLCSWTRGTYERIGTGPGHRALNLRINPRIDKPVSRKAAKHAKFAKKTLQLRAPLRLGPSADG